MTGDGGTRPCVHEALLAMAADADTGAPGAAVTVELCGHWDHSPPCPLAPHSTTARRVGEEVRLRILFVVEPAVEGDVRRRIDLALARGELRGPAGVARWRLVGSGPGELRAEERERAARLGTGTPVELDGGTFDSPPAAP